MIPLQVITRAQAQDKELQRENETEIAPSEKSNKTKGSWKARREIRATNKWRQEKARAETEKEKSETKET